jgi:hypothetical protein
VNHHLDTIPLGLIPSGVDGVTLRAVRRANALSSLPSGAPVDFHSPSFR